MYRRYAIYFTPSDHLARKGAAWLGWDIASGQSVRHPDLPDIDVKKLVQTPQKYGFHGTIKPPFRLTNGSTVQELEVAFEALCTELTPVTIDRLSLGRLGGFLALTPQGNINALNALASCVVQKLDDFRAPASEEELTKRRRLTLTVRQDQNLERWGYPFVLKDFRFHMTLTGRVKDQGEHLFQLVERYFESSLPEPFLLDSLTLVGERSDGKFQAIKRVKLTG